jgi:hypothetical protein
MPITPSHARRHDQFYTRRDVAVRLAKIVAESLANPPAIWVEPSAGDGAFVDAIALAGLPGQVIALDIDPARQDVSKGDFLTWALPASAKGVVAALGNPPFGKNASLAVKFFNRAASFADAIGMIFPRTFQKKGLQNRLDTSFKLIMEEVLPPDSFVFEGEIVAVPCVFQIWVRLPPGQLRPLHAITRKHSDFDFVDRAFGDFAFQRVGVAAGKIKPVDAPISPESHLFIRVSDRKRVAEVRGRLAAVDWQGFKHSTAGNPSIGKGEIVEAYTLAFGP